MTPGETDNNLLIFGHPPFWLSTPSIVKNDYTSSICALFKLKDTHLHRLIYPQYTQVNLNVSLQCKQEIRKQIHTQTHRISCVFPTNNHDNMTHDGRRYARNGGSDQSSQSAKSASPKQPSFDSTLAPSSSFLAQVQLSGRSSSCSSKPRHG